ncbi:MAG: DUF1294 domain-containing protein [candidate division SR1 bacterium]|nr:DUF1294 domain-containing protein [candidate division SR1 bacterium]
MFRTIFSCYFLLINLVTFIVRGVDKYKAKKQLRRVPEKTLLILTALGGMFGAVLGISFFRHKTIKGKFLIWFYGIVILWIILIFLLMYYI